jgi:hypothetical protein
MVFAGPGLAVADVTVWRVGSLKTTNFRRPINVRKPRQSDA